MPSRVRKDLISGTLFELVEPAVRSVADRLFVLSGGRKGSAKHRPKISNIFETRIVVAIYEFLLMSPDLAHLEIRHENPYQAKTRPEQVDIWIRPLNGGHAHIIECGDFTAGKVKSDAEKMRRLNPKGTNWFLAFFREGDAAQNPWDELCRCRNRKGALKRTRVIEEEKFTRSISIRLPNEVIHFGFALIRVPPGRKTKRGKKSK
jgi:hypothetical protein